MPGEPAMQEEPLQPVPIEAVCGPRKPRPWTRASASSGGETQAQGPPTKVQRYKAPPDFKLEEAAAGPPPASGGAKRPGGTGPAATASSGTTSKSSVPKPKPPAFPGDQAPPAAHASAAPPARVPAGVCAMQSPPAVPKAAPSVPPQEPDSPALQESVVATPTSQQLATVAEAARVLEAYGFALTEAQRVAVQAQKAAAEDKATEVPQQWAGYRPGTVPPSSGDRAGAQSSSSWQRSERGQTPDDTGYGLASEHHPYHRQSQAKQRARGGWSKQSDSPQESKEEATKKRPGVPDRRERGAARGQETRYSMRDLFVDTNPEGVRIWGNTDKISAIGRPGAKALATGDWHKAGKTLRDTTRVFIKLMQDSGLLVDDKRAFGYRPSL
eukprot:4129989-Amphidinium_carterae.1